MNAYKAMSAELRQAVFNLRMAKHYLGLANRGLITMTKSEVMHLINRARAKLQQAVKRTNAFLYGN